MECQEYKKALEILNYCLTCIQKSDNNNNNSTTTEEQQQQTTYVVDISIMKKVKASLGRISKQRRNNNNNDNDNESSSSSSASFIYRDPMRLNESDLRTMVDPDLSMSSCLIFNIALCHHLTALEVPHCTQSCMTKRLKGALKLYELGFHMHSKRGAEGMSMNYALALINNCANIYELLGKSDRAQKFYSHMLSSLMMMVDGGEASKVDQLDGYLKNASRLILD